ncbi:MAG: hypothetical protein K0Q94_2062 [Paenibacillus sp.]|nr:hypothetical protein [Paenibacillus sp.]
MKMKKAIENMEIRLLYRNSIFAPVIESRQDATACLQPSKWAESKKVVRRQKRRLCRPPGTATPFMELTI